LYALRILIIPNISSIYASVAQLVNGHLSDPRGRHAAITQSAGSQIDLISVDDRVLPLCGYRLASLRGFDSGQRAAAFGAADTGSIPVGRSSSELVG
jgi:hypothetical protein